MKQPFVVKPGHFFADQSRMTNRSPNVQNARRFIVLKYFVCYLSWILLGVVGFWLIFQLRANLVEDVLFMRVNPWQLRAIDLFFMTGLGAAWLFAVMWSEGYLRNSIEEGRLSIRIGRLLLIELALIALSFGIHFLSNIPIR